MGRPRTGDKRADLARAAIGEVVERGFAAASVDRIARRAGVAVGTVYRYFDDKEALLRAVHLETKRAIHARLMEAAARHEADGSAAVVRTLWFALLDVARERPEAFLFVEAVAAQGVLSEEEREEIARLSEELLGVLVRAIEDGTLAPASPRAIATVLTAPAMRLAREAAASGTAPDPALADAVFEMVWRGVRRDDGEAAGEEAGATDSAR